MDAKKRRAVILAAYKTLFVAAFAAWIVFAFKYLFPLPLSAFVYDFSSVPKVYGSHDEYIENLKIYEKSHEAYVQKMSRQRASIRCAGPSEPNLISSVDTDHGDTNNQVSGVNEGDIIKNDGKYLYILSMRPFLKLDDYPHTPHDGAVAIIDAYPADEVGLASKIWLASGKTGESERKYTDIYVSGQNLVVLSIEYELIDYGSFFYRDYYSAVTVADIYDIADRNKPVHKRTFKLDGNLSGSREQNGILYLFATKTIRWNSGYYFDYTDQAESIDYYKFVPYSFDTICGEKQYVPAERLYSFLPEIGEETSLIISTINIAAIDLDGNAQAGVSSYTYADYYTPQLYMSAENIYLMRNTWNAAVIYTDVTKFNIDGADIEYIASTRVPGYMHNQFSADEYKGNLRIATTERSAGNHLFVLDENLAIISSVRNMASGEQIKSVRFDKEMVHMVTFKTIDPLFTIDLSDPGSPEIKSELKIPGYSTYMHPLGDGLLLGVGDDTAVRYATDENGTRFESGFWRTGIKASLFDVSDPYNPKETAVLKLGGKSSYTDIDYNHKNFLNIPKYSVFSIRGGFSYIEETQPDADIKKQALVISYDKDNGLKLVQALDGVDDDEYGYFRSNITSAVNRVTYIENILYHFDGEAVHAYDMDVTSVDGFASIGSVYYK